MRNAFIKALYSSTTKNKQICLLTGDLGYTVFEKYQKDFPLNFLNAGVAESNMVGVAAGLALSGKIPFVYSTAPFVTLRAFEQIRNDVCLMKANVKIVGVGAGIAYTHHGPSHHSIEDIGVMRVLPNIVIICPSDPVETEAAVKSAIKHKGPVYIRLGKKGEPTIHKYPIKFQLGKGITLKTGKNVTLITCGSITQTALEIADKLQERGIETGVVSMHTIKPLDTKLIERVATESQIVCTIEEHSVIGGLGSAVSEFLSENSIQVKFKRFGINDTFCTMLGNHAYMKNYYGLSTEKISNYILNWINNESKH